MSIDNSKIWFLLRWILCRKEESWNYSSEQNFNNKSWLRWCQQIGRFFMIRGISYRLLSLLCKGNQETLCLQIISYWPPEFSSNFNSYVFGVQLWGTDWRTYVGLASLAFLSIWWFLLFKNPRGYNVMLLFLRVIVVVDDHWIRSDQLSPG